jgi:ribosome maturation factor RimP
MRQPDSTTETLLRIAEPVCTGAGYELVDLSLTQSREGWVLRVFIDHLPLPTLPAMLPTTLPASPNAGDGEPALAAEAERSEISLEDCERLSRELGAVLDVEDPLGQAYHLEVSSPGLDRPLRKLEHFRRFLGHEVKVRLYDGLDGRRNFKGKLLAGAPAAADGAQVGAGERETITLEVEGKQYELPFDDIESARIVPDWDAIMGKRAGKPGHS